MLINSASLVSFRSNRMEPPIVYVPNFLYGRRKKLIRKLREVEYMTEEESAIVLRGKKVNVPRMQAVFGEENLSYSFSGNTARSAEWPKFMKRLRDRVYNWMVENGHLPEGFEKPNFVLLNRYVDGTRYIGWHADRETMEGYPIISVTLGAERDFIIRKTNDHSIKKVIRLESGSLLVMKAGMQKEWQHSLPKRLKCTEERFNMTFRWTRRGD